MENDLIITVNSDVTYGRGYVYSLQYHLVWCVKYRKQIFNDALADELKGHLQITADILKIKILAMEVMPDHVHLLIDCTPQTRISDAVKVFKGNGARWLFMNHPEIKKSLWGGHLWNPSYFVATVSDRSHEQIKRYIEEQKIR